VRSTRREALAGAAAMPVLMATAPASLAAAGDDDEAKQRAEAELTTALRIEQTAVVAYEAIVGGGRLSPRAAALMRQLRDDDGQHAQQLAMALDSMGVKPPIPPRRANIPGLGAVRGDAAAARFGIALEARAVGAYSLAVRDVADANLLRIVAGAMGTDGQHLVVLRQLAGQAPVPGAFERGAHP
jgi:ferritin-like protein